MEGLEVSNINDENVKYLKHFIKQSNSYNMLNIYLSFDSFIPNSGIYLGTKRMYEYKIDISTIIHCVHIIIKNRKHLNVHQHVVGRGCFLIS